MDSERQRRRPEAVHVVESLEEFCKKAAENESEVGTGLTGYFSKKEGIIACFRSDGNDPAERERINHNGDRGEIASWTSWFTHVALKQVHGQVKYDAFGVMTHISLSEAGYPPMVFPGTL